MFAQILPPATIRKSKSTMSIIILRLSLSLLVLVLFVNPIVVSSSSSGVQHSTNDLHWEEEIPPQIVEKEPDDEAPSSKRPLFWRPQQLQVRRPQRKQPKPHPMRTNLWKLKFTSRNRDYFQNETMIFEFDELGFCKNDKAQVGKWNMVPAGVLWKLPSGLQFYAEIHLQPFGDHPRMLRGVVVRDR